VKILKRILLIGWPVLFLDGLMVVEFPNAVWNHAAGWMLIVFVPVLIVSTLGFCALVTIRLISRVAKRPTRLPVATPTVPITNPKVPRSHSLILGLIGALAIVAFVTSLLVYIEHEFKSSTVYRSSVATARASPEILAMLGSPIDASWFVSGEISQSTGGGGEATLTIPLRGPKGRGRLWVRAQRQAGTWRFSTLQFLPDGHSPTVNLLNDLHK
jgi:hypothetical protein